MAVNKSPGNVAILLMNLVETVCRQTSLAGLLNCLPTLTDENGHDAVGAAIEQIPSVLKKYNRVVSPALGKKKRKQRQRYYGYGVHSTCEAIARMAADLHQISGKRTFQFDAILTRMSDVTPQEVSWLWDKRIPLGCLTGIVGAAGIGKSFFTCDLAARISNGTRWPDGSDCPMGSVILCNAEDDKSRVLVQRLKAHGADLSRIHFMEGKQIVESDELLPFTLGDEGTLRHALEQLKDCRAVVIDPVGSYLGSRTDAHRDNEVRAQLSPLHKLAEEFDLAVLMVTHRRKSIGGSADDMVLGSRAFTGITRSVYHIAWDPDIEQRRLFLGGKSNLAPPVNGLAFKIEGRPASLRWEDSEVTLTADDLLAREAKGRKPREINVNACVDWLRTYLASGGKSSGEVEAAARDLGHSQRSLTDASKRLGLVKRPQGFGLPWLWQLPVSASVSHNNGDVRDTDENRRKTADLPSVPQNDKFVRDTGEKRGDSWEPSAEDGDIPQIDFDQINGELMAEAHKQRQM